MATAGRAGAPMTLPATYEEAMIRFAMAAVDQIEHVLTGSAREYLAAGLRERLRRGLTDRQKVIDAAENGDDLSHDVLMGEFHAMLDEGIMPPASLRAYVARIEKHPKRGRGRVWYNDWQRNLGFCLLIAIVGEAFGLEATRNRTTEGPCGASLVATALRRRGFKRVSSPIYGASSGTAQLRPSRSGGRGRRSCPTSACLAIRPISTGGRCSV